MNQDWRNDYFETLAAAMVDFGYCTPRVLRLVQEEPVSPRLQEEVYAVQAGDDVLERVQRKGYSPANELHRGAHITARALFQIRKDMPACMTLWHSAVGFWLDQKMQRSGFEDPSWCEVHWLMRQITDEPWKAPWQPGDNPFALDMRRIPVPRASVHWLACMTATIVVLNVHAFDIVTIT